MIRIVGDVSLSENFFDIGFGIGTNMKNGLNPFKNIPKQNGEVWIGNLECVVSDTSVNRGWDGIPFRIDSKTFSSYRLFDIFSVANNHIMQHGSMAYAETLATLSKLNYGHVGSEKNKTLIFEHEGKSIGLMAFSLRGECFNSPPGYWNDPELKEIENNLATIKQTDYKIVLLHWGYEYMQYPTKEQKQFAHWLIDNGVQLVVGCHPHTLQGYEDYNDGRIYYSLGNFIFRMPLLSTQIGAIVNLKFNDGLTITHDYVKINSNGCPTIVDSDSVPDNLQFPCLNTLLRKNEDDEIYFANVSKSIRQFQNKNRIEILKNLHKHSRSEIFTLIKDFIKRRLK